MFLGVGGCRCFIDFAIDRCPPPPLLVYLRSARQDSSPSRPTRFGRVCVPLTSVMALLRKEGVTSRKGRGGGGGGFQLGAGSLVLWSGKNRGVVSTLSVCEESPEKSGHSGAFLRTPVDAVGGRKNLFTRPTAQASSMWTYPVAVTNEGFYGLCTTSAV